MLSVLHKPRIQRILRYFVDFASRNPLHGVGYLARRNIHWCEFTYWLLALLVMLIFGFKCGLQLLFIYISRNSSITINVDYMQINTWYPSVTICPEQILDSEKVEAFISNQYYLRNDKERKEFRQFLEQLSKVSSRKGYYFNMSFDNLKAEDYMATVFNLSQVYYVGQKGRPAVKVMTDVGICYTFCNFLYEEMNTRNWFDANPFPRNTSERFQPKSHTFNFSYSYPIEKKVDYNITGNMSIYMHSQYEMPTTWWRATATGNEFQTVKLVVAIKDITFQENLLTETFVDERRCRTITQSNLKMFPSTYSQHLCLMQCRADYIAKICQCIPHFYRNRNMAMSETLPVCNAEGLNCIYRRRHLIRNIYSNSKSSSFKCQCYPNCIGHILVTKVRNIPAQSNESNVIWTIEYPSLESYERSVMYSYLDYAVTLFNVMSAFLGISILSVCDLIYFFTVRIYWFRRGYRGSVDDN